MASPQVFFKMSSNGKTVTWSASEHEAIGKTGILDIKFKPCSERRCLEEFGRFWVISDRHNSDSNGCVQVRKISGKLGRCLSRIQKTVSGRFISIKWEWAEFISVWMELNSIVHKKSVVN